jgi:hypothetical protein
MAFRKQNLSISLLRLVRHFGWGGACVWAALGAMDAFSESRVPAFQKVVLILFENQGIEKVVEQSFFARLAKEGASLQNYHALTHPSQPNYIALVSGSDQGVRDDGVRTVDARHLGDLLEGAGKTWKNYAEGYPGGCFLERSQGLYVRKHTPFISFKNIQADEVRCRTHVVPGSVFFEDFKAGRLPDFSFFTPDMNQDGHDTNPSYSNQWFEKTFAPLLPEFMKQGILLITTYDENDCNSIGRGGVFITRSSRCASDSNQIYLSFYGPQVKPGTQSSGYYDHYSLLKTLEEGFQLPSLGQKDATAESIQGIWKSRD